MDRFKRKLVRDPITGRFVPFKEPIARPKLKDSGAAMLSWIDYVEVIEALEERD